MFFNSRTVRVFLYRQEIDMRAGFERLAFLARESLTSDLLSGHLYLFLGKNRKRAKVLFFDGTGLVLIAKRLETGRFMRVQDLQDSPEMTAAELSLILDGSRMKLPICGAAYTK